MKFNALVLVFGFLTLSLASCSGSSPPAPSAATAPSPPGTPALAVANATTITVSWAAVTGATYYQVWRHTADDSAAAAEQTSDTAQTGLSFTDSELSAREEYFYWIKACNASGCSAFGPSASATTASPQAPAAPALAVANATTITVSWAAVTGATYYQVWRHTANDSTAAVEQTTEDSQTSLSFTDSELSAREEYFYWIKACSTSGCSAFGPSASATTASPQAPATPTPAVTNATTITVSWAAVTGATYYQVWRHTANDSTAAVEQTTEDSQTSLSFTDSELSAREEYFYWVKACNALGCSAFSASDSATTPTPPAEPGAPTPAVVNNTTITVGWTTVTGATYYQVWRHTADDSTMAVERTSGTSQTGLSFTDSGLSLATTYYYWIKACDTSGCSAFSASGSVSTPAPPASPGLFTAAVASNNAITVSWNVVTGATYYRVFRHTADDSSAAVERTSATAQTDLSFTDSGLSLATTYYYWVRACNLSGCSGFGPSASATTPTPPAEPEAPDSSIESGNTVLLSWGVVRGANRYEIHRNTADNSDTADALSTSLTIVKYPDTNALANTTYYYWVRACNLSGCSAFGPSASVITPPLSPGVPTSEVVSGATITTSWNAVTGVAYYQVWRHTTDDSTMAVEQTSGDSQTTTSFSDTDLEAATTYYYWVRACNASDCSAFASSASVITPALPVAPNAPTLAGAINNAITVSWAAVTGATYYQVWRHTTDDSAMAEEQTIDTSQTTTSFSDTDTDLEAATTYYYWVRACNAFGCSGFGPSASATTPPTPPGAPTLAGAINNAITVSWAAVTGATYYQVWRHTTDDSAMAEEQTIDTLQTTTSFSDTDLEAATTYYYWITACSTSGCSAFGPSASATTPALPVAPNAPTLVVADNNDITASWTAVTDATYYQVWRHTADDSTMAAEQTTGTSQATTSFSDTGLEVSTTYYYWIKACNLDCSAFGPSASVITAPPAPEMPGIVVDGEGEVTVSWTAVTGATYYQVWRHIADDSAMAMQQTIDTLQTTTSFSDTGLGATTTYYYWIKACNASGCSGFGSSASATTPPTPPGAPTLAGAINNAITVSWAAVTGATYYQVWRHTADDSAMAEEQTIDTLQTTTSFSDTDLEAATTYYYWITVCSASGCSAFGPSASVITAPPAPEMPGVVVDGEGEVTVSWTAVTGATYYQVWRHTADDSAMAMQQTTDTLQTTTSFSDTDLEATTTYYYWITACSTSGCSAFGPGKAILPIAFNDALDTDLEFTQPNTQSRTADWVSQISVIREGIDTDAVTSGAVAASANSCFQTNVTGPGLLSFYWKVSSDETFDILSFSIDGEEQDRISGEVDWRQQIYRITALTSTVVEWCYSKDSLTDVGDDKGYVDGISYTQTAETTLTVLPGLLRFEWNAVEGTDHYRLQSSSDGGTTYMTVTGAGMLNETNYDLSVATHLFNWAGSQYRIQACDMDESVCNDVSTETLTLNDSAVASVYAKAANTQEGDEFGISVALSSDGNTMAVGAPGEDGDSDSTADSTNNAADDAGAVYVFVRSSGAWTQQAYIKAANAGAGDSFGISVALSSDGNTMAVGAPGEDSDSTTITNSDTITTTNNNDNADDAGAVYVFVRSSDAWTQQAYIKATNAEADDNFGASVALNSDGNRLAAGANFEDSDSTTITNSDTITTTNNNNNADDAGAVYVFVRSNDAWTQQAYIKAANAGEGDEFGAAVALSSDGDTLAVGANFEEGSSAGINGLDNNEAFLAGAAYVFVRSSDAWAQQAYIKAAEIVEEDNFGVSVSLSGDGNTLAVGADQREGSEGSEENDALFAGAAYVFVRASATWTQEAYIEPSNSGGADNFAKSIALNSDGNILAVGAWLESSNSTVLNSGADNDDASGAGAAYIFERTITDSTATWSQRTYLKAPNTDANDNFGRSIALNGDGNTLAVGANFEDSNSTVLNSGLDNDEAMDAGAVYIY